MYSRYLVFALLVMKAKRAMEQESNSNDTSQNISGERLSNKPVIPKSLQNIAKRHFASKTRQNKRDKPESIYRPSMDSYSNSNSWTKSYTNPSFQSSSEDDKDSLDTDNFEYEGLQELVQRQNMEIQELQEEYESWYEAYTHRVDSTKLRHKEEQRQLLRSLQRQRQYEKSITQGRPLQYGYVYPSHVTTPYHVYSEGVFTTRSTSRSVATTYRPYMMHRLHNYGTALPVDKL